MQCTSYFANPTDQALLTLQVREAELRVAREELAFLQACGGVVEADVRRLRRGLGLREEETGPPIVVVGQDNIVAVKEEVVVGELVSLKSVLQPLMGGRHPPAQACRRAALELKRCGVATFRRHKVVHVRREDVPRVAGVMVRVGV